jgi:deoxycytidylate deaminase
MVYGVNAAIIAAKESMCRYRVGAALLGGKRVYFGFNKRKTHPWLLKYKYKKWSCIHAELDVLLKANKNNDCDGVLYVARLMKNGEVGMAKPCEGCMGVIVNLGVSRVVYTISKNKIGEINCLS